MKLLLKLSLVLSVSICTQAACNIYYQYSCSESGNSCSDNSCCKDVSFSGALPIYSARGPGGIISIKADVYSSSDCGVYHSYSYGCYSSTSATLYAAMTENTDPKPPKHPCTIGSGCPIPYGGHFTIEGKVHNGRAMKLQSNKIPDSFIYTDGISFKTYYILLTNPAAKRLEKIHPKDYRLDYFKEHYDLVETRDVDDNLVGMSFNPKN